MKNRQTGIALIAMLGCCLACFLPFSKVFVGYLFLRFDPWSELVFGAGAGDIQRMSAALDYGADVNGRYGYANRTPLMIAAIHDKPKAIRFLLSHGAAPNLTDDKGLTARELANKQHYPEVVQILLSASAKP